MMGVTLSRWTMVYFAAAVLALIGAEALMLAGYGFPDADIAAPRTLFLVHLVAIGWLSLLICGALFQFVPVLVARPIFSNSLPLPTVILLLAGLALLLAGFLQLDGTLGTTPALLPWGGALLVLGFALAIYNLARTLWLAPKLAIPARFVAVALVCLAVTATLGFLFTLNLTAISSADWLAVLTGTGLPLHVIAGLGGWLTFTAMGVSYRLLAMFMLAPETTGRRTTAVFWLGVVALTVVIVAGLVLVLAEGRLLWALLVALVLSAVALGLYLADMAKLYRTRRRPVIELNSRMASLALASLAATVVLLVALTAAGLLPGRVGAVVFLAAFGWLSGLGLAKLYKIIAFLTWLESYGPVLGKLQTPRVQDLAVEPRARPWFYAYFGATWVGALALLVPVLFRLCAAVMLVATVAIARELYRIRRLADIKPEARLADAVPRPRLLTSIPIKH